MAAPAQRATDEFLGDLRGMSVVDAVRNLLTAQMLIAPRGVDMPSATVDPPREELEEEELGIIPPGAIDHAEDRAYISTEPAPERMAGRSTMSDVFRVTPFLSDIMLHVVDDFTADGSGVGGEYSSKIKDAIKNATEDIWRQTRDRNTLPRAADVHKAGAIAYDVLRKVRPMSMSTFYHALDMKRKAHPRPPHATRFRDFTRNFLAIVSHDTHDTGRIRQRAPIYDAIVTRTMAFFHGMHQTDAHKAMGYAYTTAEYFTTAIGAPDGVCVLAFQYILDYVLRYELAPHPTKNTTNAARNFFAFHLTMCAVRKMGAKDATHEKWLMLHKRLLGHGNADDVPSVDTFTEGGAWAFYLNAEHTTQGDGVDLLFEPPTPPMQNLASVLTNIALEVTGVEPQQLPAMNRALPPDKVYAYMEGWRVTTIDARVEPRYYYATAMQRANEMWMGALSAKEYVRYVFLGDNMQFNMTMTAYYKLLALFVYCRYMDVPTKELDLTHAQIRVVAHAAGIMEGMVLRWLVPTAPPVSVEYSTRIGGSVYFVVHAIYMAIQHARFASDEGKVNGGLWDSIFAAAYPAVPMPHTRAIPTQQHMRKMYASTSARADLVDLRAYVRERVHIPTITTENKALGRWNAQLHTDAQKLVQHAIGIQRILAGMDAHTHADALRALRKFTHGECECDGDGDDAPESDAASDTEMDKQEGEGDMTMLTDAMANDAL